VQLEHALELRDDVAVSRLREAALRLEERRDARGLRSGGARGKPAASVALDAELDQLIDDAGSQQRQIRMLGLELDDGRAEPIHQSAPLIGLERAIDVLRQIAQQLSRLGLAGPIPSELATQLPEMPLDRFFAHPVTLAGGRALRERGATMRSGDAGMLAFAMLDGMTRSFDDAHEPLPSAITVANVVYALHAFAIVVGILGSATVIGSFVGSVPSIVAVVLNYIKRGDARDTWLESHYRWQIRTFWYALLWVVLAGLAAVTVIGIPVAIAIGAALTLWLIYRIARGWMRLRDQFPMPI
jgi:uncharacterized membrane protein